MRIEIEVSDRLLERLHRAVRACGMTELKHETEVAMSATLGLQTRAEKYEELAATGYRYTTTRERTS
jgi:hypothetical protein